METVNEIGTDRLDSNQTVVSRNESRIMKSNPKIKVSCRNIRLIAHFCNSSQLNPLIMNLSFQNYLNCTIIVHSMRLLIITLKFLFFSER